MVRARHYGNQNQATRSDALRGCIPHVELLRLSQYVSVWMNGSTVCCCVAQLLSTVTTVLLLGAMGILTSSLIR